LNKQKEIGNKSKKEDYKFAKKALTLPKNNPMNLWHIQLHPTGATDWTPEDTRRIVATGYIGCSGKAVQTFEKLLVGDLVLVRYGGQVVALVAVEDTPRLLRDYEKHSLHWFSHGCRVKALAYYDHLKIGGRGWYLPTTIQQIKPENEIAYAFVKDLWEKTDTRLLFSVDFNELLEYDLVLFSQKDARENVCGELISLYEGLKVNIYMGDGDDKGNRDDLVASGYVTANTTEYYPYVKWCCRIDEKGIRSESEGK
jgi:hypothetical protein